MPTREIESTSNQKAKANFNSLGNICFQSFYAIVFELLFFTQIRLIG